jgi:hypothetical protein
LVSRNSEIPAMKIENGIKNHKKRGSLFSIKYKQLLEARTALDYRRAIAFHKTGKQSTSIKDTA